MRVSCNVAIWTSNAAAAARRSVASPSACTSLPRSVATSACSVLSAAARCCALALGFCQRLAQRRDLALDCGGRCFALLRLLLSLHESVPQSGNLGTHRLALVAPLGQLGDLRALPFNLGTHRLALVAPLGQLGNLRALPFNLRTHRLALVAPFGQLGDLRALPFNLGKCIR